MNDVIYATIYVLTLRLTDRQTHVFSFFDRNHLSTSSSVTIECNREHHLVLGIPFVLGLVGGGGLHEVVHEVHGHGEDDGGVVLRRDAVQRLEVPQLQETKRGLQPHTVE